jgi:hypothetical protein
VGKGAQLPAVAHAYFTINVLTRMGKAHAAARISATSVQCALPTLRLLEPMVRSVRQRL